MKAFYQLEKNLQASINRIDVLRVWKLRRSVRNVFLQGIGSDSDLPLQGDSRGISLGTNETYASYRLPNFPRSVSSSSEMISPY